MPRTIWWLRRDLRLHDNPALAYAMAQGDVVPVFVLDPALLQAPYHRDAHRRRAFLFAGLTALDTTLQGRGSRLILRSGRPEAVLPALVQETDAACVVAAEDFSPFSRRRDAAAGRHVDLVTTPGIAIHSPRDVLKQDGEPFRVFTPYSRTWRELPLERGALHKTPGRLPPVPTGLASEALPDIEAPDAFPAGEAQALERLAAFGHEAIQHYAHARNRLDHDGTSALSPYLRFGMLSPRLAAVTARESIDDAPDADAAQSASAWLNELAWRDFYLSVLYHFPHVLHREFDGALRDIPWRNDAADIEAWQQGRTGYPIIDAAMRQLAATGWMHNRARMLVASFLVKHLLVDWRVGEAWFMQQLVDGDPAANNGGWQWTAGVGTDAAPYFRVFNPVLQAKRFDPDGAFVRQWLPELRTLPERYIHEPWRLPSKDQAATGFTPGRDYPRPIIGLDEGRQRALEAYRSARLG